MRKKVIPMMLSAMAILAGCRMQEEAPAVEQGGDAVHFVASSDNLTRTVFGQKDGTTYRSFWTGNETVGISLNYGEAEAVGITVNGTHTVAEFDYTPAETADTYTFLVVTPASALQAPSASRGALTITVPAEQTPLLGSVDEAAQVFYAATEELPGKPATVDVRFSHLTAYGKLTLSGVQGTPVRLTLVAGRPWVGTCYVTLSDGTVSVKEGGRTLTLDLGNYSVSGGTLADVWFACLPADLSGTPLTVLVETAEGKTWKRTVPQLGDAMDFTPGKILRFSVNMASATEGETAFAPAVLSYDQYGAYLSGHPMVYDPATDQLSREYLEDGTVTFTLLDPVQDGYVAFSGIPEDAAYGDSFTLTVQSKAKGVDSFEGSFEVTVVKEAGARLWLSDGENGFIVKR